MKRALAVSAAIALFLVAGLRVAAQTSAEPAFEVASIKPSPPVMTVLNEQLGLTLESTRGPVDVLVIDSVHTPAPD